MGKTQAAHPPRARTDRVEPGRRPAGHKASRPKGAATPDRGRAAQTIGRLRPETESPRGSSSEARAELGKLTGAALSELLKVKERRREDWTRELDQELEKLLVIQLLLEESPPAAPDSVPSPAERPRTARTDDEKRVLVVDDDPTTVKLISHFLHKEGYRVSTSLSGTEGLKKAFRESPDMIVLDILMPDLNGFQFLSIFRQVRENARVPVLILSSLAEEADILKGLEIGAVDYITKPFSPQLLIAKIKKNLSPGP
jgi:CheY-like chemotaxis protein